MGVNTNVSWTDSTWNPWEGCQNAGPGCDHCYAEARDQRWHAGSHFGPGAQRRRVVDTTFRKPIHWSMARARYQNALRHGLPWTADTPPLWVFAMSLGDFLDNAVPDHWRNDAWEVIRRSPHLRFQIVTKRIGNLPKMLPGDWEGGLNYQHVGFISTVCTQAELDRDFAKLDQAKSLGAKWIGLSVEPQLERVEMKAEHSRLDWVICGGESKQGSHNARPWDMDWGGALLNKCSELKIPFHMKQFGSNSGLKHPWSVPLSSDQDPRPGSKQFRFKDRAGADMEEWPHYMRHREMPRVYDVAA